MSKVEKSIDVQVPVSTAYNRWTRFEEFPQVAWAATEGATNAGAVVFTPSGPDTTTVTLELDYEPEGLVEHAGDALGLVTRQATADLERFKQLVEQTPQDSTGWRGSV